MSEIFFEDYQVSGLVRSNRELHGFFNYFSAAFLAAYKYYSRTAQHSSRYCLVVDSGYSFTHILPISSGSIMEGSVIR